MKHIFHPIIGDSKYGEGRHNRFFESLLDCPRMLLAATELAFSHPYTGTNLTIQAPLDAVYTAVLERLVWRDAVSPRWLPG